MPPSDDEEDLRLLLVFLDLFLRFLFLRFSFFFFELELFRR